MKYSPSSGLWTWVSGAETRAANSVYGTEGTASTVDGPGARQGPSSWIDSAGDLWLFGGYGHASGGASGNLNDLWKFDPTGGTWTWMSGTGQINSSGSYGSPDVTSSTDLPRCS